LNLRFVRFVDRYIGIPLCYLLHLLEKIFIRRSKSSSCKKILLIKTFGIGNILMLSPTFRALRKRFPGARIDLLTLTSNKGILKDNPFLDRIYYFHNESLFLFVRSILKAVSGMRKEKYDVVLDFEQFAKVSAIVAFLTGAPERVGFNTPGQGRGIIYTKRVAYLDYTHMIDTFSRIAKPLGIDGIEPSLEPLPITDRERKKTEKFLADNNLLNGRETVLLHPGSGPNMEFRRWEAQKFARLADLLVDNFNVNIVISAVPEEKDLVEKITSHMKHRAVSTLGQLSIKELAELISRCKFIVSNDTCPVHIASAMGTPVVGFYGPNTPYLYGPRGDNNLIFYRDPYCSPCITNYNEKVSRCTHPFCIRRITVEEVYEKIKERYFSKR